jgi:hypothetical protein
VTLDDPLHAFCYGTTVCTDNGTVTPTTTNPPKFGFSISPGPQTGDYIIDVLVPNNDPHPASYSITGTQGGLFDNASISATAGKLSGQWTSGNLSGFIGISASPTNPLSNWLDYTKAHDDPGATGYFVYQANLGLTTLQPNANELAGPLLTTGTALQPGSVVTAFLNVGTPWQPNWIATASSGGLYVHKVPEPGTLALFAVGLLGVGLAAFRAPRGLRRLSPLRRLSNGFTSRPIQSALRQSQSPSPWPRERVKDQCDSRSRRDRLDLWTDLAPRAGAESRRADLQPEERQAPVVKDGKRFLVLTD